jgi:hypothetical protein
MPRRLPTESDPTPPRVAMAAAVGELAVAGHLLCRPFLSLLSRSTAESPSAKKSTTVTVAFKPSALLDSLTSLISAVPGEPRTEGTNLARDGLVRSMYAHHSNEFHLKCIFLHGCSVRAVTVLLSSSRRVHGAATSCSRAGEKAASVIVAFIRSLFITVFVRFRGLLYTRALFAKDPA